MHAVVAVDQTAGRRRRDRRPILIVQQKLTHTAPFAGNVYAKWSHVILAAHGTFRSAFATGSLRVATAFTTRIEPINPLPPAFEAFLIE